MAREYTPKPPNFNKLAKNLIDDCKKDRTLAFDAYKYFKDISEENPQDNAAKSLMVDCLKIMQSSKTNVVKILNLVVKMEEAAPVKTGIGKTTASKGPENSLFNSIDDIING